MALTTWTPADLKKMTVRERRHWYEWLRWKYKKAEEG